jgi:hypothetical protein
MVCALLALMHNERKIPLPPSRTAVYRCMKSLDLSKKTQHSFPDLWIGKLPIEDCGQRRFGVADYRAWSRCNFQLKSTFIDNTPILPEYVYRRLRVTGEIRHDTSVYARYRWHYFEVECEPVTHFRNKALASNPTPPKRAHENTEGERRRRCGPLASEETALEDIGSDDPDTPAAVPEAAGAGLGTGVQAAAQEAEGPSMPQTERTRRRFWMPSLGSWSFVRVPWRTATSRLRSRWLSDLPQSPNAC